MFVPCGLCLELFPLLFECWVDRCLLCCVGCVVVFGFVWVVVVSVVVVVGCCSYGLLYRNSKNTPNKCSLVVVGLVCLSFVCFCVCFCFRGLCLGVLCLLLFRCCWGGVLFAMFMVCLCCGVCVVCIVASVVDVVGCCWYGLFGFCF